MPNARGDQAKLLARRQSTFGAAEAAAGNRDAAIAAYRKVIEINPDGGWATTAARRISELGG